MLDTYRTQSSLLDEDSKIQRGEVSQMPHSLEAQEIQHLHRTIIHCQNFLRKKQKQTLTVKCKDVVRQGSGRILTESYKVLFPILRQCKPGYIRQVQANFAKAVSLGNLRVPISLFQSHQLSNINDFKGTEQREAAMATDSMERFMCWALHFLTRSFKWFYPGDSALILSLQVRKQEAHQLISSPKVTWVGSRKARLQDPHSKHPASAYRHQGPSYRIVWASLQKHVIVITFLPSSWPSYQQECDIKHLLDVPLPHVTLRFAQSTVLKHVRKLFIYKQEKHHLQEMTWHLLPDMAQKRDWINVSWTKLRSVEWKEIVSE